MISSNTLTHEMESYALKRDRRIIELVISAIPYDKYVFCGEVTRLLDKHGIHVEPDAVRRIVFVDHRVKRLWSPDGWKVIRQKMLPDYFENGI